MKKKSDEEKCLESGIESNVGITYKALSQFFALIAVIFMLTASVSYAVMANPSASIWTTDELGTEKTDFAPDETVYISGSGFDAANESNPVQIQVTRPDAEIHFCTNETWCPDSLPTTPEFSLYPYILDGIEGLYTIDASDGTYSAQTTFTDAQCSNIVCTSNSSICSSDQCDGNYWYYENGNCKSSCPGTGSRCEYNHRICADANSGDGVPDIGGIRTCSAACDQNSDCPNVCSGTKTKTADCKSNCTCGSTGSAYCLKDSCGAVCDSADDCQCVGNKYASGGHCHIVGVDAEDCSCGGQGSPVCDKTKCGASCAVDGDCTGGKTCDTATCQCVTSCTAEKCNGLDDDCDTLIDEDFPNKGQSCSVGVGACQRTGTYVCKADGSGTECNAVAGTPSPEVCTGGLDEDCDDAIDCADSNCKNCITIFADKIVCNSESDLSNRSGGPDIISTTASDYVRDHQNCYLTARWDFQWRFGGDNPGDNLEYAPEWNTFGSTDANGRTSVVISNVPSSGTSIWFREALKAGYLQFSGASSNNPITAEFYCDGDVLNYDNYDNLNGSTITDGSTFYCVGFNALAQYCGNNIVEGTEQCDGGDCCNTDCTFKSSATVCRVSTGTCDKEEKCTGSSATCPTDTFQLIHTDCGACKECDGSGNCNVMPVDDPECGTIDCDGLDTTCRNYNDLTTNRCKSLGACKSPNSGDCTDYTNAQLSTPCEADQQFCTVDHCNSEGSCVYWKPYDCSLNNLLQIAQCDYTPDNYLPTFFDYAAGFTSVCDEQADVCSTGTQTPTHTCADANASDGGPIVLPTGGVSTCSAECDGYGTECQPYYNTGICYYGSTGCNTDTTSCSCGYQSQSALECQTCTQNGPKDLTGPVVSNIVLEPNPAGGTLCIPNITAVATETCTNIAEAKYWIDSACNVGAGHPMSATDGAFDNKIENVEVINIPLFDEYGNPLTDGGHNLYVKAKNSDGIWGACVGVPIKIDRIEPTTENGTITNAHWIDSSGYWICADNGNLTGEICDFNDQSFICEAEFIVDQDTTYGDGYPMDPLDGSWGDSLCEEVNGTIVNNDFSEGRHWTNIRGHDCACNWEKDSPKLWFVIDRTPPVITKSVGQPNVSCGEDCYYITKDTPITFNCADPDNGNGYYSDDVTIFWRYKINDTGDWHEFSAHSNSATFYYPEDSNHTLEYWCEDACGNGEEQHYFETDIVDTVAPSLVKSIDGPSYGQCLPRPGTSDVCFIDGVTKIHVVSVDPEPHPVDTVTCDWDYTVTEGGKIGHGETGLVPPFDINFPEESTHVLTITCRDALGNSVTDVETFQVDKTPPTTTKTYGTPRYPDDASHAKWINSSTLITLTVVDSGPHKSGIKETKYRVTLLGSNEACESDSVCQQQTGEPGSWNTYSAPFTIAQESCHLIEYNSVDNVEKTEQIKKQCVYVENTAPVSSKTLGTPKHACESGETLEGITDCSYVTYYTDVTLTCNDLGDHPVDQVKIKYKIDWKQNAGDTWTTGSWIEDSNQVTFKYTKDSYHKLTWYCVDALGNIETPQHVELDIVDTQAPETVKTISNPKVAGDNNPINWYITDDTQIELNCTDNGPHPSDHVILNWAVYYTQGECMPADWGTPILSGSEQSGYKLITGLSDSCHKIVYHCVDALGNAEIEKVEIDAVDNKVPSIVKTIVGPSYASQGTCPPNTPDDICYIDGVTKIHVVSTDPTPHPVDDVKCDWDYIVKDGTKTGTGQTNVVPPFDINFPEESTHVLTITCRDALGNSVTDVETFQVDKTAPTTTKTYGTPLVEAVTGGYPKWITSATSITLTVNDTGTHKSGIKETKYRITLLGSNEACESDSVCQQQTGSGSWNTYTDTVPFTIGQESCHLIEYYSIDNVEKTEITKKQCVYVENTAPVSSKTLIGQQHACETSENLEITDCSYITKDTEVKLTCADLGDHPVDQVKINYKVDWKQNAGDTWTTGSWIEDSNQVTFKYTKDSYHKLTWYCVDALGNTETPQHVELDIVDTQPPVTTKTVGQPSLSGSGFDYWITQNTPITLTCSDGDTHPVDHVTLYARYKVDGGSWVDLTTSKGYVQFKFPEDSVHTLEYYCVDALGNTETTHVEIDKVDSTPPITIKSVGSPTYPASEPDITNFNLVGDQVTNFWIVDHNTHIILDATDKLDPCDVGVKEIHYRVGKDADKDNDVEENEMGSWIIVPGAHVDFTIDEDCLHKIEWLAVDLLGNAETPNIQYHRVDSQPPEIVKIVGDPFLLGEDGTYWITTDSLIDLDSTFDREEPCDVGLKNIEYRIWYQDEWSDWKDYTEPFTFENHCVHWLDIRAIDYLDNTAYDLERFVVHGELNLSRIEELENKVTILRSDVDNLTIIVENNTQQIIALWLDDEQKWEAIWDLQAENAALWQQINLLWLDDDAKWDAISILQVNVSDLNTAINEINTILADFEARITALESEVTILRDDVDNLIIAVDSNTQEIIALWLDDEQKWEAIWDLQAENAALWEQINLLWLDDDAKWDAIHILQMQVTNLWSSIDSLWDAIEALQVPSIIVNTLPEQEDVNVILDITTDEPAYCRYSLTASGYAYMTMQFENGEGTTEHTTPVAAKEGLNFYFVSCQDLDGHSAPTSEIIIFKVEVEEPEFCGLNVDLFNSGRITWRMFWLPGLFVEDLTEDNRVQNVMKGIKGKYDIIYYHDDSIPGSDGWKSFDPNRVDEITGQPINSLTVFDEEDFEPYIIKMTSEASKLEEIPVYDDFNEECGWVLPECSDGLDNDEDNRWDYEYDPECLSPEDDTEAPVCGDGLTEGDEECDDNGWNGFPCDPDYDDSCDYCSETCEIITLEGNYCGDGTWEMDEEEECDDGNNVDGDGCSATCTIEEV